MSRNSGLTPRALRFRPIRGSSDRRGSLDPAVCPTERLPAGLETIGQPSGKVRRPCHNLADGRSGASGLRRGSLINKRTTIDRLRPCGRPPRRGGEAAGPGSRSSGRSRSSGGSGPCWPRRRRAGRSKRLSAFLRSTSAQARSQSRPATSASLSAVQAATGLGLFEQYAGRAGVDQGQGDRGHRGRSDLHRGVEDTGRRTGWAGSSSPA